MSKSKLYWHLIAATQQVRLGLKTMPSSKDIKYKNVARAVIDVTISNGLSALTISKVSRKAKVSRAWIYQYFGREKKDLVEVSGKYLAEYFSRKGRFKIPQTKQALQRQIIDGNDFVFAIAQEDSEVEPME